MPIPNTSLGSAGLGNGSPLKGTIYSDLARLLANDSDLQTQFNTLQTQVNDLQTQVNGISLTSVEVKIAYKNCGGTCSGTCYTTCSGACTNFCSSCTGSCTSCSNH